MISCGARLAVFDIAELREVTSYDELELDTLGDRKTALFLIMSDTDDSFNFLISMCYTQLFNLLCEKADDVYGGRLPQEVRNMSELKPRITENGIDYILVGDYYIPDLKLPEEHRPIGKYGRMHREYLREAHPARLNTLTLTGELWTYLADLNEQAQERLDTIMEQMKAAEGVTEELKRTSQMEWVQRCNNIHNRAEEIILQEMIYS